MTARKAHKGRARERSRDRDDSFSAPPSPSNESDPYDAHTSRAGVPISFFLNSSSSSYQPYRVMADQRNVAGTHEDQIQERVDIELAEPAHSTIENIQPGGPSSFQSAPLQIPPITTGMTETMARLGAIVNKPSISRAECVEVGGPSYRHQLIG